MAHVSRDFHQFSPHPLITHAGVVRLGIKNNPNTFSYTAPVKPPHTDVEFEGFITLATDSYNNWTQGGRAQKALMEKDLVVIMNTLNEYAPYVDTIADGDEATIVLSGFNVADGVHPASKQTTPGTPVVNAVRAEASGEIDSETTVYDRAVYGCLVSEDKSLDVNTTITAGGQLIIPPGQTNRIIHLVDIHRKKKIVGLTKGKNYWIYYYVSNTAGTSQLSTGFEILCG